MSKLVPLCLLAIGCSTQPLALPQPAPSHAHAHTSGYVVSGTATVRAPRDVAELSAVLSAEARAPDTAAAKVRALQQALQDALGASTIALDDQAISALALRPVHEPIDRHGIRTRLRGYEASLRVVFTLSDLDALPELMTLTADVGATEIATTLRVADRTVLKRQAREDAARAAADKARAMAQLLGFELGRLCNVAEQDGPATSHFDNYVANNEQSVAYIGATDAPHGELESVTVTVTLTYDL